MSKRDELIQEARKYLGVKFADQGRSRLTGFDCGGLYLVPARTIGLSDFEFLAYARFPRDGKFDELLEERFELLFEKVFPFGFTGEELKPADLLSFDYGKGDGTQHLALVTGWDGRRYRVLEAQPSHGVIEHVLGPPFVRSKTSVKGWRIRGIDD